MEKYHTEASKNVEKYQKEVSKNVEKYHKEASKNVDKYQTEASKNVEKYNKEVSRTWNQVGRGTRIFKYTNKHLNKAQMRKRPPKKKIEFSSVTCTKNNFHPLVLH